MIEREEWVQQDKHICGKITDPKYRIMEDMTLRVGKRRWVKFKVTKCTEADFIEPGSLHDGTDACVKCKEVVQNES